MKWWTDSPNRMRCGRTAPQDSAFSSPTPAPTPLEWPSQEEPRSGSTASASVSDVSAPACTNGYGLLCGLWVWRRTNRRPWCPPMSYPSTSPRTAWPDGAGRWDNWMGAQHLFRDLVRPSSGFNNSLKRMKNIWNIRIVTQQWRANFWKS